MKLFFDARFTRTERHDGISRYGSCLLAALLEAGRGVWAGLPVPATVPASGRHEAADLARPVERAWRALGLGAGLADRLTLPPACGLAGAGSQAAAVAAQRGVIDAAVYLHDVVHDS